MFSKLVLFILVALLAGSVVADQYLEGPWGKKKLSPAQSLLIESARRKVREATEKYGVESSQAQKADKELRDLVSLISGQPVHDQSVPVEPKPIDIEPYKQAGQAPEIPTTMQEQELRSLIQDEIRKLQGEILTTYSPDGEPIHQSQDAKGWHRQFGAATLDNGRAIVNLNSSPAEGKQDVSFMADSTYRGVAWSLDTTNTNIYWIIPLSGTQILVKSSDNADTATVRFLLEGM